MKTTVLNSQQSMVLCSYIKEMINSNISLSRDDFRDRGDYILNCKRLRRYKMQNQAFLMILNDVLVGLSLEEIRDAANFGCRTLIINDDMKISFKERTDASLELQPNLNQFLLHLLNIKINGTKYSLKEQEFINCNKDDVCTNKNTDYTQTGSEHGKMLLNDFHIYSDVEEQEHYFEKYGEDARLNWASHNPDDDFIWQNND